MKKLKKFFRYDNIGYFFVLPAVIYMLFFVGYPIVSNFILSFQDVTVKTLSSPNKPFAGIENYQTLFQDEVLRTSIINTLLFTVLCLVFQFMIGFLLALFFNRRFSFAKPVRGLLMMPWMIPITVTALIFKFMFSSNVGIINQALMGIGLISAPIDWLTQPAQRPARKRILSNFAICLTSSAARRTPYSPSSVSSSLSSNSIPSSSYSPSSCLGL